MKGMYRLLNGFVNYDTSIDGPLGHHLPASRYTADLKRPVSQSRADKQAAVDELIDVLALEPCRNVLIGRCGTRSCGQGVHRLCVSASGWRCAVPNRARARRQVRPGMEACPYAQGQHGLRECVPAADPCLVCCRSLAVPRCQQPSGNAGATSRGSLAAICLVNNPVHVNATPIS